MSALKPGDVVWVKARLLQVDTDTSTALPYAVSVPNVVHPIWLDDEHVVADAETEVATGRRERIACAAMQGLLAFGNKGPEQVVEVSVDYADALLAALERKAAP